MGHGLTGHHGRSALSPVKMGHSPERALAQIPHRCMVGKIALGPARRLWSAQIDHPASV